jgi:hydroxymethylpyrimidine/phosphomethylpyrimidine kinase
VVFDPVMEASSGAVLMDDSAIAMLVRVLLTLAALITPNLDEAALLATSLLQSESDMEAAATELLAMGAQAVLLKGGHLQGEVVSDLLALGQDLPQAVQSARVYVRDALAAGTQVPKGKGSGQLSLV